MAALTDTDKGPVMGTAASFYASGKSDREPYLSRARRLSELTVPTLFRDEGASGSDDQIVPWNSIGAYLVNNLASKVVFAMFPPGRPNFKAEAGEAVMRDLRQLPEDERAQTQLAIEAGLSELEQRVAGAIETDGDRARMFVAALRMIVGGNHGLQFYSDGTIRGIPLERFVAKRDPQGNLLRFAVLDPLDWLTLDKKVRDELVEDGALEPKPAEPNKEAKVEVFTYGTFLPNGQWLVHQEAMGRLIRGTSQTYDADQMPYLFLPWVLLDGEHYGRSYAEFYEGDLLTTEVLTKTIGQGVQAIARLLTLVNPVGMTDKKQIARSENGAVISGREQDVHTLKAEKGGDFAAAQKPLDDALERLARAFLLNSSVQRNGERVTAEEIRYVAQELEDALGGVYSQQVVTWQGPYVRLKLRRLQNAGRVPPLPQNAVKITVTAGLAALARNAELTGLRTFAAILKEALPPDQVAKFLKADGFVARVATALGIDKTGLIPTKEELEAQAEQEQQMAMMQQLGPDAIRTVGQNLTANQVADTNAQAKMASATAPAPQTQEGA